MTINNDYPDFIAGHFANSISAVTPLGNGLINDTFLVTSSETQPFILQRINRHVFPQPELITANLLVLNEHIQKQTDVRLQMPAILRTTAGLATIIDEQGDYWRAQAFIAGTESLENLRDLADATQTGFALGHFHRLVSTLATGQLHDTLPGFHIAPDYLAHYETVSAETPVAVDPFCADFIKAFTAYTDCLETAKQQGHLPLRVIHGDPKLNNFLFALDGNIISLIDLDTVKPGLVHYDIGDCLRSCCHNPANHTFNLGICAAILEAYLNQVSDFFTDADYDYLYPAIALLPFELGLRFYTDYLQNNCYFKVTYPEQNLHRAHEQFQLCTSVQQQRVAIEQIIAAKRLKA